MSIYVQLEVDSSDNPKIDFQSSGSLVAVAATASNELTFNESGTAVTLKNIATPSIDSDVANKGYVDSVAEGLSVKDSVRAATTVNGELASAYANGETIDGVTLSTGDRILLKNQSSGDENGIYVVQASGAPARADDLAVAASGDTDAAGVFVFVEEGTTNADSGFVCSSDTGSARVGTDSLTFTQFSGAGSITAGTNLNKSGNTLNLDATLTGMSAITASGTITAGTLTDGAFSVSSGEVSGATTIEMSGALTMSNDNASITHSGSTQLAITSDSGTVKVEDVVFTGGAISAATTLAMSDDLTMSKDSASINHSGSTQLAITSGGNVVIESVTFDGQAISGASSIGCSSVTASGAITAGSFVIGNADISETDLEKIDDITDGSVTANKALVVDASRNLTGTEAANRINNLSIAGSFTDFSSLVGANSSSIQLKDSGGESSFTVSDAGAIQTTSTLMVGGLSTFIGGIQASPDASNNAQFTVSTDGEVDCVSLASTGGITAGADINVSSDNIILHGDTSGDDVGHIECAKITASGAIHGATIRATSDERYKENIEEISGALDTINQLRAVHWNWKEGQTEQKESGIIAQQLLETPAKNAVFADSKGHLSVNYNTLVGYLLGAVKELSEKLDKVESSQGTTRWLRPRK